MDKLFLNPGYKLRSDKRRVLLFYKNEGPPLRQDVSDFIGFLHPLFAILLGLFDGEKSLNKVVEEYTYLTGFKKEFAHSLVSRLVENKSEVKIDLRDQSFLFPKNTLVRTGKRQEVRHYNPYDFLIPHRQLDFKTRRLYDPLDAMLILNNKCATRCLYCYVDKRKSHLCRIPLPRLKELIREAGELGIRSFNISGGEIFTYTYWRELLKMLVENGFDPYVTTKYPLPPKDIHYLKEIGIKRINLSLDTLDRGRMREMLKVNDKYYDLILKTLKGFKDKDFEFCIQSLVTSLNQDSMEALFNYLLEVGKARGIKVRAVKFSLYPGEGGDYQRLRPDKNKLAKIKALLNRLAEKHGDRVQLFFRDWAGREQYINPSAEEKQSLFENRSQCPGNFSSFVILPDGKVTLCEELYWHPRFIMGDVLTQSIREIWNSEAARSLYHLAADGVSEQSACKTCAQFSGCRRKQGVCWKQVLSAYGEENWDYPDPRCPRAPQPGNELWIE